MGSGRPSRVTVTVFDGPHLVETRTCRFEAFVDGRAGIIYRGLVHPLLDGDRIDLSGPAFAPGAAAIGAQGDTTPATETWRKVVRGEASGYVLIEGSVTAREATAAVVREAGATILRSGRYLGAALEDASPDWFVRFELGRATFSAVEAALGVAGKAHAPGDEAASDLRARLLVAELAQARARIAATEAENARLRVERAEIAAIAATADAVERLEAERIALQEALINESRAREAAEALATETASITARPKAPRGLSTEIETVLRALIPRVRLVRDSLVVAAVELHDRAPLYRALAQLDASLGGWPPGWKKLQAANGWWERHLSDGASDAGRLYARLDARDRSLDVLISTKAEQPRDIAWLRRDAV